MQMQTGLMHCLHFIQLSVCWEWVNVLFLFCFVLKKRKPGERRKHCPIYIQRKKLKIEYEIICLILNWYCTTSGDKSQTTSPTSKYTCEKYLDKCHCANKHYKPGNHLARQFQKCPISKS